jgi:competence protein ComEA
VSLSSDHKALLFVGAVAVLGAAVRVVRWMNDDAAAERAQPALDHQLGAADFAARAARRPQAKTAARSRPSRTRSLHMKDSPPRPADIWRIPGPPPRDPPGYLNGRLDLDAATAAQIDSLPGIGPTLATRIVADREERGPFVKLEALRRVAGVGPALVRRIDTLVTFSATLRPLSATPESISARSTARRRSRR